MSIQIENASYIYEQGTAMAVTALSEVSAQIREGEFIGLIGHTGSGKSTLVQLLDGLIRPTSGRILFDGKDINAPDYVKKELRAQVGLVFQYPEHQLFEADVLTDVMFGPKNLGLSDEDARLRAQKALEMVGIGPESFEVSPFDLSGGQKRRAAIAGVLAMEPKYLILDEPTAGLDPEGRDEILEMIAAMRKRTNMAILLVSHSMEDVARHVERIMVMAGGRLLFDAPPAEVFSHIEELEKVSLAAPQVTYIMRDLHRAGIPVRTDIFRAEDAAAEIARVFSQRDAV
ncbi:MAG: energy-coupling factor transporter ATPase [Lachnospiraceae bacterium]|nr:energy-coupling factor transporter ATPase [Lachnospiraceae bacterium]